MENSTGHAEKPEESDPPVQVVASSSKEPTWKKGHRRAWSMPNAKGEKMTVAVIQDSGTNVSSASFLLFETSILPGEIDTVALSTGIDRKY